MLTQPPKGVQTAHKSLHQLVLDNFILQDNRLHRRQNGICLERRPFDEGGYKQVVWKGKRWSIHRLTYLYVNGWLPDGKQKCRYVIDHINGLRYDNNPWNLRCASQSENKMWKKHAHYKPYSKKKGGYYEDIWGEANKWHHSPETKAIISATHKGKKRKPFSDAHRAKIRAARLGKKNSEESKRKQSIAITGRKHTAEARARMSVVQKGREVSDECKAKLRATNLGKKHTEETKIKCSIASKKRKWTDEQRAKMSKAMMGNTNGTGCKGREVTAEQRAKLSAALKGRILSAETRAKMSKSRQGEKHTAERIANYIVGRRRNTRMRRRWQILEAVAKNDHKALDKLARRAYECRWNRQRRVKKTA